MIIAYCVFVGMIVIAILVAHSGWHGWSIDHSLKPVELVSIAINVGIALLVQSFLTKRSGDSRVEKDILLDDAKQVVNRLRECNEHFIKRADRQTASQMEWRQSIALSRNISNALQQMNISVTVLEWKDQKALSAQTRHIEQLLLVYKQAVTNDPPKKKVSNDAIRGEAEAFRNLMGALKSFVFEINKHS